MRKWLLSFAFLAAWMAVVTPVYAQNAQITGVLKDQSGGVLPGVTLTARNAETGLTRTAVSGPVGEYRVPALPPGTLHSLCRAGRIHQGRALRHRPGHRSDGAS